MVKARKKLSKSAWILLAVIFVAIIAVAVLAVIGYISLQFLADMLTGLAAWGALSPLNVAIILVVPFVVGMGVFYWLKAYIIGEEQVMMGTGLGYAPTPSYPSAQPQEKQETEIS